MVEVEGEKKKGASLCCADEKRQRVVVLWQGWPSVGIKLSRRSLTGNLINCASETQRGVIVGASRLQCDAATTDYSLITVVKKRRHSLG